jgi:exo-1,4-beta-D-glucosaminidase
MGWCCCDHWENWDSWDGEDFVVAQESQKSQVTHLRNHPSALAWFNASDNAPPPLVERAYIDILEREHWPNPYVSSADDESTTVTGFSGVKMAGPYEYVPPVYWYDLEQRGAAFGFNTETSPGEAVPPLESLERFIPPEDYWPFNPVWRYHTGRGWYMKLGPFTQAIDRRYGEATGIADYAMKSQVIAYDNHRAMFEAYSRNKYLATGVVQWMMNNGWPSMIWHLYDYYLRPGGAYFGAKKSCEMLHVQYSYDDQSIVVVNSYYRDFPGLKVTARVFDFDLNEKSAQETTVDIPADSSTRVFFLPEIDDLTMTYFVKLTLTDAAGDLISDNFYWLSTKPVEFILNFSEQGPRVLQDADMTMLAELPPVALTVSDGSVAEADIPGEETLRATIANPTDALAFCVELRLINGPDGVDVLPITWSDNYFSLLPGEAKTITATYRRVDLNGKAPTLVIGGWNSH